MASEAVNKYIEKRYDRWLDYAMYHSSLAGMNDEACDVLNEVLVMLLQKDESVILRLLSSEKGKYTELDFYILQMIKLNITSETSPYRHKYKSIPVDDNINWQRLNIADIIEDVPDKTEELLQKMQLVRDIVDKLDLSDYARKVFSFKFFHDESFSDWPGPEDKKELYDIYNKAIEIIKDRISGNVLF